MAEVGTAEVTDSLPDVRAVLVALTARVSLNWVDTVFDGEKKPAATRIPAVSAATTTAAMPTSFIGFFIIPQVRQPQSGSR